MRRHRGVLVQSARARETSSALLPTLTYSKLLNFSLSLSLLICKTGPTIVSHLIEDQTK